MTVIKVELDSKSIEVKEEGGKYVVNGKPHNTREDAVETAKQILKGHYSSTQAERVG